EERHERQQVALLGRDGWNRDRGQVEHHEPVDRPETSPQGADEPEDQQDESKDQGGERHADRRGPDIGSDVYKESYQGATEGYRNGEKVLGYGPEKIELAMPESLQDKAHAGGPGQN